MKNLTKAELLQKLVVELSKNSLYSKSIFKKYEKIGLEIRNLDTKLVDIENKLKKEIVDVNPEMTVEKINEYVKTNKIPSKQRPIIEKMISEVYKEMHNHTVNIPKFNWIDLRKMNVGMVDLLKSYGLVDERKFMFLFKTHNRVI